MSRDKCSTKFCRGKVALKYFGKLLCQACYEEIYDLEDKEGF